MKFLNVFNRIMEEQVELALATCKDGIPNVRVVNFCYDKTNEGIIYFSSFRDNKKVEEFAQNNRVAFTTIPHEGNEHVRVKNAMIQRSTFNVYDVKEKFIKKIPDYEMVIEQGGESLILFEIHFKEAEVTINIEESGHIVFEEK